MMIPQNVLRVKSSVTTTSSSESNINKTLQ